MALLKSDQIDETTQLPLSWTGTTLVNLNWDDTISLWDIDTGNQLALLSGHTNWVGTVAFSPDGWTLASAGQDGKIRLWDPINGNLIAVMSGHIDDVDGLAFSLLMVKPLLVQVTAPSFCGTLKLSETHIVETHFN